MAVAPFPPAYNSEGVKALVKIVLIAALACCALLYAGDYASVRFHIPRSRETTSTVEVQPYYAVPLKGGKTEFMFLKPENQVCVNSLFPHLGYNPCWYVRRHRDKPVNL
jgi:hypothetical protein